MLICQRVFNFYKRKTHKNSRDIGCFNNPTQKYTMDCNSKTLQTTQLGKYESTSLLRRLFIILMVLMSTSLCLFIVVESIRAFLFLFEF